MRTILKRKEIPHHSSNRRPALHFPRLTGMAVLLLWISITGGCGLVPTTAHIATTQVQLQPAATPGPFHTVTQTFDGDFTITLDITPNRSGPNTFTAHIIDNRSHSLVSNLVVTLYLTMQEMPMGTDSVTLQFQGNGLFSTTSDLLSMNGHWAIGITLQTTDHIIHKAGVLILVAPDA